MKNTSRTRDVVKSQIEMLGNLLKRNEQNLNFLAVPRLLPEAYQASLAEVTRRKFFLNSADKIRCKLSQLIAIENDYRKDFLAKYRHILPSGFIPQLSAGPSLVSMPNDPDRNLPDLSMTLGDFTHKALYLEEN